MILLVPVLLILAVAIYAWLRRSTGQQRRSLGIDRADGQHAPLAIVGADDSRLGMPTLRSERFGLVGRPDQLLRSGRVVIPVEHKPAAQRLQPSHVLQVAAQCLLVQETYGRRPPYGLVVLAGGVQEQVDFTPQLERRLLATMQTMRDWLAADSEPGRQWSARKCRACGFNGVCWPDSSWPI